MDEVERRYTEFCREYRERGDADPRPHLEGLGDEDRNELLELLDAFLVAQPPAEWNAEAFERSGLGPLVDEITREADGRLEPGAGEERLPAGVATSDQERSLPDLLPRLRHAAQLRRDELAERLAGALGSPGELDRVQFYYHHLERGSLPAGGVSGAVFDALGAILGVGSELLRGVGARQDADARSGTGPVFARSVTGTEPAETGMSGALPEFPGRGRVDRHFLGEDGDSGE